METTIINNNLNRILYKLNSADKFLNSFNGGNIQTQTETSTSTEQLESLNLPNINTNNNTNINNNINNNVNIDEQEYLNRQINDLINMKNKILGGNDKEENNTYNDKERDTYLEEQFSNLENQQIGGINTELDNIDLNQYGGKKKKSLYELNRKVDDLHAKAIDDIKKIMKCSDDEAAVYKSVIYRKVKAENPDLGGVERAQKMFDFITKDFLKNIDLEAETEKRVEEQKENSKKKEDKEDKEEKKGKKKGKKEGKKEDKKDKKTKKTKNLSDEIDI